ncbi:MAG: nitronate monooxygenase, partial [Myxococcota bacterium]
MIRVAAEEHRQDAVARVVAAFRTPCVIDEDGRHRRTVRLNSEPASVGAQAVAQLGGLYPEWLGDRSFNEVHGVRAPYVAGAMANGIASPRLVVAMARAGLMGVFGAGGLSFDRVKDGLDAIERALPPGGAWASNLIHSPHEPALEEAVADLYLQRGVRRISASAYLQLTPAVVRYAATGVRDDGRRIVRRNHVLAKVSHPEVARAFMSPAPQRLLDGLVARGQLTSEEACLARRVPVAEDVTVEADSGGHTDNRPLGALLPVLVRLRDGIVREHDYPRPLRVGAAGGLGTPAALAAAFAMGADYVLTGSVNQASVEAALSRRAKELLLEANLADVTMAPSPDMFEMGVKVQVLRRGTLF